MNEIIRTFGTMRRGGDQSKSGREIIYGDEKRIKTTFFLPPNVLNVVLILQCSVFIANLYTIRGDKNLKNRIGINRSGSSSAITE